MYDVIHIGQHKCASTYLQKIGLAAHPEIDLVWRDHKGLFFELADYGFGFDCEHFRQAVMTTPLSNPKTTATKRVFSHEALCGDMLTGRGARLIADLVVGTLGKVRAFVVLREPYSMMYSCWNQYVQQGGVLGLKPFLNSRASPARPTFVNRDNIWRRVQFIDQVDYWCKLVGAENFGVFLLEDLTQTPERFHDALYRFIGVDVDFRPQQQRVRSGYPHSLVTTTRFVNRLLRGPSNQAELLPESLQERLRPRLNQIAGHWPESKKPSVRDLVPAERRMEIAASNRALGERLGRDLAPLGYEV